MGFVGYFAEPCKQNRFSLSCVTDKTDTALQGLPQSHPQSQALCFCFIGSGFSHWL